MIRIARAGRIDEDLLDLIAWNTRDPEERLLDLRTQIGTNQRGGAMLLALVARMGWPAVAQSIEDILTYTGRRLRSRIAVLPDGSYRFERAMDDDGFPGEMVPIVCTATIAGDALSLDFDGSGPQARGAINLPDCALKASGLVLMAGEVTRAAAERDYGPDRTAEALAPASHAGGASADAR